MRSPMLIEGYTVTQILDLPDETLDQLVLTGEALAFRAGSAEVLGQFRIRDNLLVVELAQIEGGGEGVLPALWALVEKYARQRELDGSEWIVHAVNCAAPNPKLRRILELRGFEIKDVPGVGQAFYYRRRFSG
ncbi:MAG: hypothetical protein ACO1SX_12965 [Actinomycetota bacterium]